MANLQEIGRLLEIDAADPNAVINGFAETFGDAAASYANANLSLWSGLTADSADVNNSTTFVDSGLSVTLPATGTYRFDCRLVYTTAAAADLKVKFTGTATVTAGDSYILDVGINGTKHAVGDSISLLSAGALTDYTFAFYVGFITVTAAGTFKVQFAQNTADPTNTHIDEGAFLAVQRVA